MNLVIKVKKTINNLIEKLLLEKYMGTDVTGTKYNKKICT